MVLVVFFSVVLAAGFVGCQRSGHQRVLKPLMLVVGRSRQGIPLFGSHCVLFPF